MNEHPNREERLAAAQKLNRHLRRTAWIGVILLGLILSLVIAVICLEQKAPKEIELPDSYFSPTYEGNIMEYPAYLALDRSVTYCNDPSGYGLTTSMTEEHRNEFPAGAWFLYQYIEILVSGDTDAYNALFNEQYYKKNDPHAPFTPQMIYKTEIRYRTEEKDGRDTLVAFWLEYRIFENDGTFRRDIGSDATRGQNVVLRITPAGDISIEELTTVYD